VQPERETESEKPFEEAIPADVTQASSDDTGAAEAKNEMDYTMESTVEDTVEDTVAQNR
jgi:hypothetical protein